MQLLPLLAWALLPGSGVAGSKPEVQRCRFSLRNDRTLRAFPVTVERLSQEDTGTFLWGVPCVSPGCGAVTGPGRVLGFLGETLSVTCTYQTCRETLSKFCCKPATSIPLTCAEDFVISSESNPEVQQGRFSIWNNHTHWAFRVTVEGLAKRDTGTVHCGVGTGLLQFDEIADVETLHVSLSATVTPRLGSRGPTVGGGVTLSVTETRCPSCTGCIHPSSPSATPTLSPDAPQGTRSTFRYFPVLAGLQLLALLAMSAAVLWVSLRDR
ncbi:CMRF-35-like molecule 4 [Corvus moneduloides]|uniref:CMRF-35-like molecule 4 n=1 Tax=Corvus moneduloides TaxID=1196302 RepID=UPI0013630363|nr:CMRF-35-like molecule 4 [Corvus moneduloides]